MQTIETTCDKCQRLFPGELEKLSVTRSSGHSLCKVDLCGECLRTLERSSVFQTPTLFCTILDTRFPNGVPNEGVRN